MARRRFAAMLGTAGLVVSAGLLAIPGAVAAEGSGVPGMCLGRSDPGMTLNAHAHGTPKYILNLETDTTGDPTGVLILGRGATRVYVDDLCRFWQHMPGQEPGGAGEEGAEGATTAHAVGIGMLADGTRVLVRTDVRANEEGMFYRARYRVMGQHGGGETPTASATEGHEDDGHEDESWTRIPAEGWAPLDQLNLR